MHEGLSIVDDPILKLFNENIFAVVQGSDKTWSYLS